MKRLADWSSEEAFEAERALRTLVESDGWRWMTELAEYEDHAIQLRLKTGKVPEQAEMAKLIGRQVGIESVLEAPQAVFALAEKWRERLKNDAPVGAGMVSNGAG